MKKKYITINDIDEDKIMSPYAMKNILGGSYPTVTLDCGCGIIITGLCAFDTCEECYGGQTSPGCDIVGCQEG